jgi:NAD(P)-dependent dehydrogenase (short-subunit alcohol dehydrogenase family)
MLRRLLVVGARPEGLGGHIAQEAIRRGWIVDTAGIQKEQYNIDVRNPRHAREFFEEADEEMPFTDIVCTVGINSPWQVRGSHFNRVLDETLATNAIGPMALLSAWVENLPEERDWIAQFVAISSNSARIPRTQSAAYCMSKAALSMGLRVAAREMAKEQIVIYGYEPGFLEDTPMSEEWTPKPPHRIPSGMSLKPSRLARMIVHNLSYAAEGDPMLNGCMFRVDGGEV